MMKPCNNCTSNFSSKADSCPRCGEPRTIWNRDLTTGEALAVTVGGPILCVILSAVVYLVATSKLEFITEIIYK